MSSMRFNARLDNFLHGTPHTLRDTGVVVAGEMVKCLFVVNGRCIHKGLEMSSHVKTRRYNLA
jgi:hypothetical protein